MSDDYRDNITIKRVQNIEALVSLILQIGVTVSSVIILLGLVLFFTQYTKDNNPLAASTYQQYLAPTFTFPNNLTELEHGLQNWNGISIIMLGLLLLMLTPILRVATSILIFLRQHDTPMTLVTLFVLIMLLSSFFVGMLVK